MKIELHPYIEKKLTKLFFTVFVTLLVLITLCIYGNKFIPDFESNHYFKIFFSAFWIVGIFFFYTVWRTLKYVKCPICHGKTECQSTHKAMPDHHSAYCKSCDILWNLGIGNSD
jgi:hypothetical protein